ncbi:MAG: 4-(cytidine 5'-diphospho)-2-C-methyl-D-erythritol kinase [Pseudomonadota bacterium]
MGTDVVSGLARAKINLCLHITGQRPDGYHLLDSLVAFAQIGDCLIAERAPATSLTLAGPFGADLPADGDNLVLQAAALMPDCPAALRLEKNLPVAAGLGGGSADAAAALHVLARLYDRPLPQDTAFLNLGADVPVCMRTAPTRMSGIGETLTPGPELPPLWALLINPRVPCPTPPVFRALDRKDNASLPPMPRRFDSAAAVFDWLAGTRNDLEAPATGLVPAIGAVLEALRHTGGGLARMSGSGASCFGLYAREAAALDAADAIRAQAPEWWVAAAPLAR